MAVRSPYVVSGGGEADSTGVYPVEHHLSGFLVLCAVHANGAHYYMGSVDMKESATLALQGCFAAIHAHGK